MIWNQLDFGGSHPWHMPLVGQEIGDVLIEGVDHALWPRGAMIQKEAVTFKIQAWQGIGGAAATTLTAVQYLLKQAIELSKNRDCQPIFVQWTNTAQPGVALATSDLADGWWLIADFEPDYSNYAVTGIVQCKLTATFVAAAPPRSVALAYQGAALSTNFSGTALNLVSLPVGSTAMEANFTRSAAEGLVPCVLSPVASPEPMVLSTTTWQAFTGGVHVYDSIS